MEQEVTRLLNGEQLFKPSEEHQTLGFEEI